MRSNKPYTNATFTRRVDHEAGRHRPPRAPTEPRLCLECGAAYLRRRWYQPSSLEARATADRPDVTMTRCPACWRKATGPPSGYVRIEGAFYGAHRDEIERVLRAEAARAAVDNPLARLMGWQHTDGVLTLTTTTEHLAQRLVHALHKAFDGTVRYRFSHENKLAHVTWRRE